LDSSFNNSDSPNIQADASQPVADSPATERFKSCRWRKAAEDGIPDHCTHRDVLPMAGTAGFVPDSWCPDCAFYKARRVPKKREEAPPMEDNWRRSW
jgi:hypothetical protein